MRFGFDDDTLAFRDAVRTLLAKECPPEVVRAAWPESSDAGAGARAPRQAVGRVWAQLADMGVLGVATPEPNGLGFDELGWVLLAEEAGYAALPHPFVETVAVAAPVLAAVGDPGGHLDGIVGGTTVVTAALDEASDLVAFGAHADLAVLRVNGGLSLVARDALRAAPVATVDGSRGMVRLADRSALYDQRLTDDPAVVSRAWARGVLGTAAQLVGLGARMLETTVAYVTERQQFGVPVGSFQAVKHHLADALMHLELARPAVYRAAHSLARDEATGGRDVSMAKAMASDAAVLVGAKALQCHGAIGYTVEYDLHLYLKRARALAASWGTAAHHRDRVGQALGV